MIEVLNLSNVNRNITMSISFSVEKGEIVGLFGPSGVGKTTICDMITGFIPYSGNVTVDDLEACAFPNQVKAKIGYMPQKDPLYPELKVSEYLTFVAKLKKIPAAGVANAVESMLNRFDLTALSDKFIMNLSKDACKKLSLAAALIADPEILILDEPVSDVSCETKGFLLEIIKEVSEEKSVLIASTSELDIFDRTINLNNEDMFDSLEQEDTTDELLDNEEIEAILEEELLADVTEVIDEGENENEEEVE